MRQFPLFIVFLTTSLTQAFLDNYYCGVEPVSKSISYLTASLCGTDPVNHCCYEHDACYEWNKTPEAVAQCDRIFADCTYRAYAQVNQKVCANLVYWTHGRVVADLGSNLKGLFGYTNSV
uniref:Phospholipase A2 n=1 Tax=Panagrellus redivivus TaxID=6233 RepID=A0A7E4VUV0_PANRE